MEIMVLLIAISLVVACLFLLGFIWSVKNGQFEDTVTPAHRILEESDLNSNKTSSSQEKMP
jgi:cbb3-type cytochrome oxidase maturation protein